MPEESSRNGLLVAAERRRFLATAGKLLALTGLATLSPSILKWLRLKADQNQGSAALYISENRIPAWHPSCSALHRDALLTICKETSESTFEQVTLKGNQARLWCLCGGVWTETELVTTLASERRMRVDQAAREVEIFLRPLYQQGFLIAADKGRFIKPLVHETEASLRAGEIVWQQSTD
jgi:hypothetical protein